MHDGYDVDENGNAVFPQGITVVEKQAFYRCETLKRAVIPEGVTEIGYGAFFQCESLTELILPDTLEVIEFGAFSSCTSLTSLVIPPKVKIIPQRMCMECTSLESIVLPEKTESISHRAFYSCKALKSIVLPPELSDIALEAFKFCNSLTSVEFPESLTHIGNSAFENCESLSHVVFPNNHSQVELDDNVFRSCAIQHLDTLITDGCRLSPDGKSLIYCANGAAEEFHIPDGVVRIENMAFERCSNLKTAYLPESVTILGWGAFFHNENLERVFLSSKLECIYNDSFANCPKVELFAPEGSMTEEKIKKSRKLKALYKKHERAKAETVKKIKAATLESALQLCSQGIGCLQTTKKEKNDIKLTIKESDTRYIVVHVPVVTAESKLNEIRGALELLKESGFTAETGKKIFSEKVTHFDWYCRIDGDAELHVRKYFASRKFWYSRFTRLYVAGVLHTESENR